MRAVRLDRAHWEQQHGRRAAAQGIDLRRGQVCEVHSLAHDGSTLYT